MRESVFVELEFILLVASSLVIPVAIYIYLFRIQTISRLSVLAFSVILIALSAADVYLLQTLAEAAKSTLSALDDKVFSSGLSVALYVLPAIFAGIAVNLISHLLNKHLDEAERRLEQQPVQKPFFIKFQIHRQRQGSPPTSVQERPESGR